MRSPDTVTPHRVALRPLLIKELWEVLSGRALWTMLLILCPLVGYSFFQATSLYGEASAAARDQPLLASGLSPLDGVLVPSFGAVYLAVTLLFPFVAIRTLGREKETGALRVPRSQRCGCIRAGRGRRGSRVRLLASWSWARRCWRPRRSVGPSISARIAATRSRSRISARSPHCTSRWS